MITPIFPDTESIGDARFRYSGVAVFAGNLFFAYIAAAGIFMVVISFFSVIHWEIVPVKGPWAGFPMGFLFIWFGFITLRGYFGETREIVVDDDGISALAFGRVWRSIRWTDVDRIDRIRFPPNLYRWRARHTFVIHGCRNDEIRFAEEITNLTVLLKLLNRYIEQHHIPLAAFDRGPDTRAKVRATTLDPAERKRLLREGYRTSLSSLTAK